MGILKATSEEIELKTESGKVLVHYDSRTGTLRVNPEVYKEMGDLEKITAHIKDFNKNSTGNPYILPLPDGNRQAFSKVKKIELIVPEITPGKFEQYYPKVTKYVRLAKELLYRLV